MSHDATKPEPPETCPPRPEEILRQTQLQARYVKDIRRKLAQGDQARVDVPAVRVWDNVPAST